MNKLCMLFAVFINILYNAVFSAELPNDIIKCHFGNSECLIKSINGLLQRYPKGIPEIGLDPLDVAFMEDVSILDSPYRGPIWLTFHNTDNVYKGLNNATVTHIEGFNQDPTKSKIEIKIHIPRLVHQATYNMQGQYLLFRINTTGKLESDFQNFRMSLTFKVILEYRNNKRYLKIYELVPKVQLDRWIIWFDGLYKENTDLTIAVNRVFNQNWIEFWNGVEPGLMKSFATCFTGMLNKVFENIAYDDMFLPNITLSSSILDM